MHITHLVTTSDIGHVLSQTVFAYEMQFSCSPRTPAGKWRSHHKVMVVAKSIEEAIMITRKQYPDDATFHQVICRSNEMPLLIAEAALSATVEK